LIAIVTQLGEGQVAMSEGTDRGDGIGLAQRLQSSIADNLFVHCDHEYLNFRGGKFSKSRGAAVDVPYFLSRYDPDPRRYYLTATAPETRDTEFSWEDFVEPQGTTPQGWWLPGAT
jgi:leucyl-tRNA synthetase